MTIALACAIATTFLPPAGWTIVKIEPPAQHVTSMLYVPGTTTWQSERQPPPRAIVHLTREIKPGESVTPPDGCMPVSMSGR
jgi:hypothetical protein